jgi:D-amino-acid dehydrogenase
MVRGVALDEGENAPADQVLLAGGPWTPEILVAEPPWPPITRTWGVTVQVGLADPPHHVLEEGVVHTVNVPSGLAGSLFSLIAVGGMATVGSTFLAEQPDAEAVALALIQRGSAFVPALADAPVISTRMCARPQSIDGRPFIGLVANVEGQFVCAGHGPWGISTGPGSAALVVDLLLGRPNRVAPELRSDRAV